MDPDIPSSVILPTEWIAWLLQHNKPKLKEYFPMKLLEEIPYFRSQYAAKLRAGNMYGWGADGDTRYVAGKLFSHFNRLTRESRPRYIKFYEDFDRAMAGQKKVRSVDT